MIEADITDPRIWPVLAASFTLFAFILAFGGKPERWGVATLLLMLLAQSAIVSTLTHGLFFQSVDPASFVADSIGLTGFTAIMWRARRLWPILAFALQLLAVIGHLLQATSQMVAYTYVTFKSFPTMTIILIVLIATYAHQRRLRRDGGDPDWVPYKEYGRFRKMARELQR